MQALSETFLFAAIFNLGGWEIILVLAVVLILFGAKKLPELARGLALGIDKFRDAVDSEASDAGRSVGGIYGKRAVQALTPDNQVAELYDPGAFERDAHPQKRRNIIKHALLSLWTWMRALARRHS